MMTQALAMLAPGTGWEWLNPRLMGEATLIAIAAIALGYGVSKIWPARFNPPLFGVLAALLVTAGFAYAGSTAAAIALGVLFLMAMLVGLIAFSFG